LGLKTSVYLSNLQHERLQTMAQADSRSASNLVQQLIDEAWQDYLAKTEFVCLDKKPIEALCPSCNQASTFSFIAFWPAESDLYVCESCRHITTENELKAKSKLEAVQA
jgi:hypothetical protein